jgi:hypothetical protein
VEPDALNPAHAEERETEVVLQVAELAGPDTIEYLDTGKVLAESVAGEPIMFARPGPTVEYWEGEE